MKRSVVVRPVLLISLAAASMAATGAWLRPVWHDELYTLALARLPIDRLFSALVVDSGPPLYYLLCRTLFALIHWQEASALGTVIVRLPSVLAFACLPWLVWRARAARPTAVPWESLLIVAWLPLLHLCSSFSLLWFC